MILVIAQSEFFVESVLDNAKNSTKAKFVILIECEESSSNIALILEHCWRYKFLNVVVIPSKNKVIKIYTYFPFREGMCFDHTPVLIDSFNNSSTFNNGIFPRRKVWNLQNCTLKISSFDYHPIIYFENMKMEGLYSPVFYAMAGSMNFSPQFVFTDEWFGGVSGPKKTGVRGEVFSGRAHLGFTFLGPLDFDYLDYDSLPMTGCLTWCCPGSFKKKSLWWLVVGEFSPAVWMMLILSAAGTIATDFVIRKFGPQHWAKPNSGMYIKVWGALLQGSGVMPSYSTLPLRAFWTCWLILSVVLATAYLSTLKSFQAAPHTAFSPNNLEELADTGLQAWYHKGFVPIINAISESNAAVAKLRSNSFIFPQDMYGAMINRLRHKNITGIMSDNLCQIYSKIFANEFVLFPVPDACMQMSSWHFFVMERKSVFSEAVRSRMSILTQAGIVQRTWSGNQTLSKGQNITQKALSLEKILPAFLVLIYGLIVSSVVFLLEKVLIAFH